MSSKIQKPILIIIALAIFIVALLVLIPALLGMGVGYDAAMIEKLCEKTVTVKTLSM